MAMWMGGDGNDVLSVGTGGDDWFEPGYGANSVTGDDGRDVVVIRGFTSVFPPDAGVFTQKLAAYPHSVNTIATAGGDDVVILDHISGIDPASPAAAQGRQNIHAGAGNDWVEVSAPTAVTVFGGDGDDVLLKTDLRTRYTRLAEGSSVSTDSIYAPDNTRQDEAWTDFDILAGGAGNDIIRSGDGPDWVYGDDGDDWIELGAGYNVAYAGAGNDVVVVRGFSANLVGSHLPPTSYNDYSSSANAIWAGEGNDVVTIEDVTSIGYGIPIGVNGEGGDDWIRFETLGPSVMNGGDGNDTLLALALPTNYVYGVWYAAPADVIYAGAGDDAVYADRGDDLVFGGEGHDWIFGGMGSDTLYPGSEAGDAHASDRISLEYPSYPTGFLDTAWALDTVNGFQSASRYGANAAGQADKIDIASLMSVYASGSHYGAANPFDAGYLRLVASGADTQVELNTAETWRPFLTLVGVTPGELDTTVQADLSGGLATASGGDFLWYTG